MKKMKNANNYVTNATFIKEVKGLHSKIDTKTDVLHTQIGELHTKIDTRFDKLSIQVLENKDNISRIMETMATKSDLRLILDRIDHLVKKVTVFDGKVLLHDYRLNELEPRVLNHENRISALEKN